MSAALTLKHADKFPFTDDADLSDWAVRAANGALADLCDRGGIKHTLEEIKYCDPEVAGEILTALAAIIKLAREDAP